MSGEDDGESVDPREPNHDPDDSEPHRHSINPWWVLVQCFIVSTYVILGFTSHPPQRRGRWHCTSVVGAAKASTRLWYVNSVIYRTFDRYFSCSWTGNLAPLSGLIANSVSSRRTSSVTGTTGTALPKSGQKGPHVSSSSSVCPLLNLHVGILLKVYTRVSLYCLLSKFRR